MLVDMGKSMGPWGGSKKLQSYPGEPDNSTLVKGWKRFAVRAADIF